MNPIRRRDLAVVVVGLAVAGWLLVRSYYGSVPPLHWYLPLPLGLIALAEALGARTLRIRLQAERDARSGRERPTAGPRAAASVRRVEPMLVARVAVLAQASAWVGAAFAGLWTGVLLYVAPEVGRLQYAAAETFTGVLGLVFSAGLVTAALWLESVCRIPPGENDSPGADARA